MRWTATGIATAGKSALGHWTHVYSYTDSTSFRAGSYGGYNAWRGELARHCGYTDIDAWEGRVTEGLMFELVNFSDCEGTLGPVVCRKLLRDARELRARFDADDKSRFVSLLDEWIAAFAFATQTELGAIKFH